MIKLEKAQAMACRGRLAIHLAHDPDPATKDDLEKEYNCKNCDSFQYCCQLSETLN